MQQKEYNGHVICYDDYKLEEKKELVTFLESNEMKQVLSHFDQKIIIVLGGDGTMLKAIQENYTKHLPFLGINFGHKGFLLNSQESIQPNMGYMERKYPLLEVEIINKGTSKKAIAMNEIDIRSGNGKMISLDVSLSHKHAMSIEGDGIIISTPAGSTGYNSSLGGPIIPHTLNAFVITPKAPWKPRRQTPILINDAETIGITNVGRKSLTEIHCDGREFFKSKNGIQNTISIKKSTDSITLIIASDYIHTWDSKVLQEQGFQEQGIQIN